MRHTGREHLQSHKRILALPTTKHYTVIDQHPGTTKLTTQRTHRDYCCTVNQEAYIIVSPYLPSTIISPALP